MVWYMKEALENIIRTSGIIDTIETYAVGNLELDELESSSKLKEFIKAVKVSNDIKDDIQLIKSSSLLANNDRSLFSDLKKLPDLLVKKSCEGKNDMIAESKAIVIGSALLLIGIAVGVYYAKKNASNLPRQGELTRNNLPAYTQHHLLLIIPTRWLSFKLTERDVLNNEQTSDLISNATRAYCYKENDTQGMEVNKKVDYSGQENIDYDSDIKVFVHLKVTATSAITEKNIKRFSIIEKISPDSRSTVIELGKLGSPRSILDFFEI